MRHGVSFVGRHFGSEMVEVRSVRTGQVGGLGILVFAPLDQIVVGSVQTGQAVSTCRVNVRIHLHLRISPETITFTRCLLISELGFTKKHT